MKLETIGQLAVDLNAAVSARKAAKNDLREKYVEFCFEAEVRTATYVGPDHPQYPAMQEYASAEVKAYARAKLTEYNLKRKLDRAVRRHAEDNGVSGVADGGEA